MDLAGIAVSETMRGSGIAPNRRYRNYRSRPAPDEADYTAYTAT